MRRRERFAVAGLVCLLIIFFMGSAVESGAQSNTPPPAKMSQAQGNAFISSRPLPSWGSITGSKDSAVNLTEGEIIYVRLGAGKEGKAGDRFTIVHAGKKMTHPVTDRKLGRAIMICGELTLLEAAGDVWVARISKSTRSIHIGDEIMPPAAPVETKPTPSSTARIQGIVLSPVEEEQNITEKEIIFIDRGSQDGVIPGDLFWIYKPGGLETRAIAASKSSPLRVGEAVVVSVQEETSTALVTHSSEAIHTGDRVVSGKK